MQTTTTTATTWAPIDGFADYEVSNTGDVRSLKDGKVLVLSKRNRNGYWSVVLSNRSEKPKQFYVHQLIAKAFIPNPDNKRYIDHINHDKRDNSLSNLRWVTNRQNCQNRQKNKANLTSSVFAGVDLHCGKYWRASIKINGRMRAKHAKTEHDAAMLYDTWLTEIGLQPVNFPIAA